jgi:NADPH-dependent curcumin reductase CurA
VVRNVVTSVDPYQLRMLRGSSGVTPVAVGQPVPTEIADPALGGPLEWISVLGTPGVTAYVGLHDIGRVRAGSSVLVSAATGAVGGVAVQLAKAAGARVVAIAGGKRRTDHAEQVLGADIAVDYRDPAFPERLQRAAGEGIDLFFDNVGGRQLTLALSVLKNHGSVVLCGSVSSYARPDDADHPAGLHRQRLLPAAAVSDPRGARGAAASEGAAGGGQRVRGP